MYHSTSSPRTSRSPCEELSGPTRGPSEIGSLHKYTKSHGRLANANKAAAPRTGARGSGADAQKLHHARRVAAAERRDRKSTRLNSSHVAISYAVFCLKKKIHTATRRCAPPNH